MFENLILVSPNSVRRAVLSYISEIRFGPPYYHLTVDELDLGGRVFGDAAAWSEDDRFLAVQEWHNTKESLGPRTSLLILDFPNYQQWSSTVFAGFYEPKKWREHHLLYDEVDLGQKRMTPREIDANLIDAWQPTVGTWHFCPDRKLKQ